MKVSGIVDNEQGKRLKIFGEVLDSKGTLTLGLPTKRTKQPALNYHYIITSIQKSRIKTVADKLIESVPV